MGEEAEEKKEGCLIYFYYERGEGGNEEGREK